MIAAAGSHGGASWGRFRVFALCAGLAFLLNLIGFVISNAKQTEHYYDLTGSLTYLSTTALAVLAAGRIGGRAVILGCFVALWALRLGSFLFLRVRAAGKDGRFDQIKRDWLRFLMMWMVQALWVLVTVGAALAAITSGDETRIGWLEIVGAIVWLVGFAIEVVADNQKSVFKKDAANQGRYITTGLWAWSRHPNYFGEIVLWLGIAIIAFRGLSGWQYVTLISPVFVFVLLTRVSGLPMLERRADKRWGDEAGYQAYKARTPALMMRPPQKAA